jgi:acetoacetyl-CoA synthetase
MGRLLWRPSEERVRHSNMVRFMNSINERFHKNFSDYEALYEWSIQNVPDFWAAVWEFVEIKSSLPYERVLEDQEKMPGARWFSGAQMNFAENLLRYRDDRTAIIFKGEGNAPEKITYKDLYNETAKLAKSLKEIGVKPGDRIAGFMPNMPETVTAMLAASSLGAIWTTCSPDFGAKGALDRFGQIKPKVLFASDGYWYKGGRFDSLERVSEIARGLPSLEKIIVVHYTLRKPDIRNIPDSVLYSEFLSKESNPEIEFAQMPFDHPQYIMYSSGPTGLPKCMVQGAGGVLINHLKELILHTDLKREDTLFYLTTTGWMMWNWMVSALGAGATIVLYDGNPFYPNPGALWHMVQDKKITVFGASAGYLTGLMNTGITPGKEYNLSPLKTILSTGSPLSVDGFNYVYNEIKKDLLLSSISGGSDINGCFALGNPMGPVYAGEIQCRGLGMKVESYDERGKPVINRQGELVCTAPVPSMPLYFWGDADNQRYKSDYFDVYPGVWRHGDFIEINDHGGVIIYGRSDATLNPRGVRIGTSEIYRQLEHFDEIEDSVIISQEWKNDIRSILFVKMAKAYNLDEEMKTKINNTLRENASPKHVPAKIISVPDIPYTHVMKKAELAIRQVIQGQKMLDRSALKNPEALDYFVGLKEVQED